MNIYAQNETARIVVGFLIFAVAVTEERQRVDAGKDDHLLKEEVTEEELLQAAREMAQAEEEA